MALSFCSNLGPLEHLNQEKTNFFQPQQEQEAGDLLAFNNSYAFLDSFIDPIFEPDDLFHSDSYTNLLPYFSSPSDNLISLSPEIFPVEEFESHHYPKRQKSYGNHYHSNFTPNFLEGFVSNPSPVPELFPEIPVPGPLPEFQIPVTFNCGRAETSVKKTNGVSLSAQSIAARERRRKITEKTQKLGKLIPGGHKMNTAEMFQAASKYVKFLQAEVGILESMGSIQEREEPSHTPELQFLLASPTIQEKLYSEEKCLVPKEFVQTLASDHEIQSKPLIFNDIDQLLRTNS